MRRFPIFAIAALAAALTSLDASAASLPTGSDAAATARRLNWWDGPGAGVAKPVERGWPVQKYRISSTFGIRVDPVRGGAENHPGLDLAGVAGTPVRASADGRITWAADRGGYGEMVAIDHGGGLATRYGHLSSILVRPGETVARGTVIGLMGSTGRSTGSHLHFEARENGRAIDPLFWLERSDTPVHAAPSALPHFSDFALAKAMLARSDSILP